MFGVLRFSSFGFVGFGFGFGLEVEGPGGDLDPVEPMFLERLSKSKGPCTQ